MANQYATPILERLMSTVTVDPVSGCWLFTGTIGNHGYGMMQINKKRRTAHSVSYELHVGPVPLGLELDHTCHKPPKCRGGATCLHRRCVNPAHLEPVTHAENMRRGYHGNTAPGTVAMLAFQRAKTHCPHGHPYDAENTRIYREHRYCRECGRIASRRWENAGRRSAASRKRCLDYQNAKYARLHPR